MCERQRDLVDRMRQSGRFFGRNVVFGRNIAFSWDVVFGRGYLFLIF